jgi:hypothetical protein
MGVLSGTCNLSNYNQTLAEITTITKAFLTGGKLRVVADGLTSNGYVVKWDTTGKAFKAYRQGGGTGTLTIASGTATTHPVGVSGAAGTLVSDTTYSGIGTVATTGAALTEAASDTDIGTFNFIIVGQLG